MNLLDLSFDSNWTLFLDRDGVINRRIADDYVKVWDDFLFLEGSLEAIRELSAIFGRIIVVSNQQGIGKGLMDASHVEEIHLKMLQHISNEGGRIDKVYFSPHLEEMNHPDRKPGTGMALKAKHDFPEIDFGKSVMVGDSYTDMQFGRSIGSINILILPDDLISSTPEELYDFRYARLLAFAEDIGSGH
jgi:histidinol-phosphate phosphatase family protein